MLFDLMRHKWSGIVFGTAASIILYWVAASAIRETQSLDTMREEEKKYSGQLSDTLRKLEERFINPDLQQYGYISTKCLDSLQRFNELEQAKGKDSLNPVKGYYIISIDSIVRKERPSGITDPAVYYFTDTSRSDSIFDAIVLPTTPDSASGKGFTHIENTNYLILNKALNELAYRDTTFVDPIKFNCYIFFNNKAIRKNISYIKTSFDKKYLYQIRFRYSGKDDTYILAEESIVNGFINKNKWTIIILSSMLFGLMALQYLSIQTINKKNKELSINNQNLNRYLKTLDKATCAIAIADLGGDIIYENSVFREWSDSGSVKGKNIRAITKLPEAEFEKNWQKLNRKGSGQTVSYISKLGPKTVVTNLSIDSEGQSVIAIENDVSMLINKYDDNLHILKNYIEGLKTLNQLILIREPAEISKNDLFDAIKQNVRALQEAINIYNNTRVTLSSPTLRQAFIEVNLKDVLDRLLDKLNVSAMSYNTRIEHTVPAFSIMGTDEDVELIFINLLLNAMQACKGISGSRIMVKATATVGGTILCQVMDNGNPLDHYTDIEDFAERSAGLGLKCVLRKIKELGGTCNGFVAREPNIKSFEFTLPKL